MYNKNNRGLCEPWATIERWCGPLPYITWHQVFGSIWFEVAKPEQPRYSFSLGYVENVSAWSHEVFLAHVCWHMQKHEMPHVADHEELLAGIGLLGVSFDIYLPLAGSLDEAFIQLQQKHVGTVFIPGERFIVYKHIRSLWSDTGWSRRFETVILYLGPNPFDHPVYSRERQS